MVKITPTLRKTVKDYYEYHGCKKAIPIRFVTNKNSAGYSIGDEEVGGYPLLLVRFIDEDGDEMSSLMEFELWKDGHWDLEEDAWCLTSREENMIRNFENSRMFR